ncbi:MAG TPA: nuclear transport factor 2 family protein [Jatrophihabitans sp.]|nr:nuclear transport factor 2 family protein [Jatrophihabitans sp.]
MSNDLDLLLAERAIHRALTRYSRGVDRFDFEAVRSCYWPDGTDDHGSFVGGVDDFIVFVEKSLNRFERTAHFLGNMLIDVDLDGGVARAETYAVAFHRYQDADGTPTDMWAGLRYVDRFERRAGEWRIHRRVCAFDWRRTDPVLGEGGFADSYVRGRRGPDDIVYHILDA